MATIEIPTLDEEDDTSFAFLSPVQTNGFGVSPYGGPPSAGGFGSSNGFSSFGRSRNDSASSNHAPPFLRKGSYSASANAHQQHSRNKSSSGHKASNSSSGTHPYPHDVYPTPEQAQLSLSQSSRREPSNASHAHPPGSSAPEVNAGPLELALYIVLDTFFERAEEKIGDALGRPIVRIIAILAIHPP